VAERANVGFCRKPTFEKPTGMTGLSYFPSSHCRLSTGRADINECLKLSSAYRRLNVVLWVKSTQAVYLVERIHWLPSSLLLIAANTLIQQVRFAGRDPIAWFAKTPTMIPIA
jgi:hypothetical protein